MGNTEPRAAGPLMDRVGALVAEMNSQGERQPPPTAATWSLHARVDRAVTDYIAAVTRNEDGQVPDTFDPDPYTALLVKATLTRRYRLSPLEVMAQARPFRPDFEAIEDVLLKPLVKIAVDDTADGKEREARCMLLLSDWIPDFDEDINRAKDAVEGDLDASSAPPEPGAWVKAPGYGRWHRLLEYDADGRAWMRCGIGTSPSSLTAADGQPADTCRRCWR